MRPLKIKHTKKSAIDVDVKNNLESEDSKQSKHTNKNIKTPKIVNNIHIKKEDAQKFEYIFDENNTLLYSICGQIKAQKIKQCVNHKIVFILAITTNCIFIALSIVLGLNSFVSNVFTITYLSLFWIPWLILKHLLLNERGFKLCIKTFGYWIKCGYGILFGIARLFQLSTTWHVNGFTLDYINRGIGIIFSALLVSYISSFDAVNISKKNKLGISAIFSLAVSFWSVYFQLFEADEFDYKMRIQLSGNKMHIISTQSIAASSARIIALFFWKQTVNTYRRKGKAVLISSAPKIVWINSDRKKKNEKEYEEGADEMKSTDAYLPEINIACVKTFARKKQKDKSVNREESIDNETITYSESLSRIESELKNAEYDCSQSKEKENENYEMKSTNNEINIISVSIGNESECKKQKS